MKRARHTTKADETPEFKAFWDTWMPVMNRNDGRGAARDEFFRHVEACGVDPQDIVDGARWYVRNGGNAEWKQHASTWLNKRAYEDDCEKERAYQARQEKPRENVVNIRQPSKSKWLQEWESKRAGQ